MKPTVLILHASGTNRDLEAAAAFELAGARADIRTLVELRARSVDWSNYQLICLAGGFSYGDALGAGKLLSLDLRVYFNDQMISFVESGKPIIGICNGFQALVKAGLLPGTTAATLTSNQSGHFECRWVTLLAGSSPSLWTSGLAEPIYCPIAHGEGRFLMPGPADSAAAALYYARPDGSVAGGQYPDNPNGSDGDIAAVCNRAGNVIGLMPHPEDHIYPYQHPRWTRGERGRMGLPLFRNGVDYVRS